MAGKLWANVEKSWRWWQVMEMLKERRWVCPKWAAGEEEEEVGEGAWPPKTGKRKPVFQPSCLRARPRWGARSVLELECQRGSASAPREGRRFLICLPRAGAIWNLSVWSGLPMGAAQFESSVTHTLTMTPDSATHFLRLENPYFILHSTVWLTHPWTLFCHL